MDIVMVYWIGLVISFIIFVAPVTCFVSLPWWLRIVILVAVTFLYPIVWIGVAVLRLIIYPYLDFRDRKKAASS